jgi:hypothetical protein
LSYRILPNARCEGSAPSKDFRSYIIRGPIPRDEFQPSAEALAMVMTMVEGRFLVVDQGDIDWLNEPKPDVAFRMSFNTTNSEEPKEDTAFDRIPGHDAEEEAEIDRVLALDEQSPPSLRTKELGLVPDGIDWPAHPNSNGKSIAEMTATERNRAYLKLRQAQSAPNYGPCARLLGWVEEHVGPVPEVLKELKG